jgi:sugar phosphate isomerase/epimerase
VDVACSTLCFARLSFDDALRTIRDLRFAKADLSIRHDGPHLTPADVLADVNKMATRLKAAAVAYAAIDCGAYDVARDPGLLQFKAVCRLGRLLAVPTVTVTPHATAEVPEEAKRLIPLARCCAAEGLQLAIESVPGDAARLTQLLKAIPGARLTLDPSHFASQIPAMESLVPHVGHVRLRDSGTAPEQFQVCVGQGEIDFGKIVGLLDRARYDRTLTVDIRDVADGGFAVDAEVRKLKYLLESLV